MKCDGCENEATVHEVSIRNGAKVERHLCERCARGKGVGTQPAGVPLTAMLSQFVTVQAMDAAQAAAAQCPACKLTFAQFKHDGKLGCPVCYAAMENQLSPLLQRAHEGGTHHTGKTPRRAGASLRSGGFVVAASGAGAETGAGIAGPKVGSTGVLGDSIDVNLQAAAATPEVDQAMARAAAEARERRIMELKRDLNEAISREHYERAAKIRDELRMLEGNVAPNSPTPPDASDRSVGPADPTGSGGVA